MRIFKNYRTKSQDRKFYDFENSMRLSGLAFKMFVSYLVLALFAGIVFAYSFYSKVDNYYLTEQENKYLNIANNMANTISSNEFIENMQYEELQNMVKIKARNEGHRTMVFNINSIVIADSSELAIGKFYDIAEVNRALAGEDASNVNNRENTVFATSSIINSDDEIIGVVLSADTISTTFVLLEDIKQQAKIFTVFIFVTIIILVYFMTRILVSPLYKMIEVIKKMSDGHINQRITISGNDEYKVLGEAFNEMANKLEKVEQTRDEFVSNVSHELKTPLSSIKVLTEAILLQQDVDAEVYVEFLQDINSEVDRMTNIVNDLLTLVKLDQSEITMNISEMDSAELINNIVKRLRPLASKKNIEIKTDIVENVAIQVDTVKISLAISNIIENAIKYTDSDGEGFVKVTTMSDNTNLFIDVTDNGIGMNSEELSKIFTRFYRVDKTRDRETGGTGLGLSITHSTILLHNGNIRVRSVENEGTTFLIKIPINYVKNALSDKENSRPLKNINKSKQRIKSNRTIQKKSNGTNQIKNNF